MKKKILLISLILIILVALLSMMTYRTYKKELLSVKLYSLDTEVQEAFKNYEIINCKFNLLNPEYAFASFQHYVYPEDDSEMKFWRIDFYNIDRLHLFSTNWDVSRTGGTTIKNTTFPELVKMVKEDCSQFQEAKGDPSDKTINWSYSPYTPEPPKEPEPKLTDEQAAAMRQQAIDQYSIVKALKYTDTMGLSDYFRNEGKSEERIKEILDGVGLEYYPPEY